MEIKLKREELHMTSKEIAGALNMSIRLYNMVERGLTGNIKHFNAAAEYLGLEKIYTSEPEEVAKASKMPLKATNYNTELDNDGVNSLVAAIFEVACRDYVSLNGKVRRARKARRWDDVEKFEYQRKLIETYMYNSDLVPLDIDVEVILNALDKRTEKIPKGGKTWFI